MTSWPAKTVPFRRYRGCGDAFHYVAKLPQHDLELHIQPAGAGGWNAFAMRPSRNLITAQRDFRLLRKAQQALRDIASEWMEF